MARKDPAPARTVTKKRHGTKRSTSRTGKTAPMDKHEPVRKDIKRTVLDIEARLQELGKVLKVDANNIPRIRKRLEKGGIDPDDTLFTDLLYIEETLAVMARVFNKPLDMEAVNRFIGAMRRDVFSPTRQARITEFF